MLKGFYGKDVKIGIVGVGKSNLGALGYIKTKVGRVELTLRSDKDIAQEDALKLRSERSFCGKDALADIEEDILLLSPSVRRDRPELRAARERGVLLLSDAELFFSECKSEVYGVTGSSGKSTCTYLIADALSRDGMRAIPCGNFGKSLCETIGHTDVAVAELSSFQLMDISPRTSSALITNISHNHLDWHKTFDEYVSSKMNLMRKAERITADADCDELLRAVSNFPIFSIVSEKLAYGELKALVHAENYVTRVGDIIYLNEKPIFNTGTAYRRESYNVKNYMLTLGALVNSCNLSALSDTFRTFPGLSHRGETIRELDGIKYVDSSIDSTPKRTLCTLSELSGRTVAIICGRGKGLPLDELAARLPHLCCGAVLMGETGLDLYRIFEASKTDFPYVKVSSMEDAVQSARELLCGGGTVILSPAGTGFDMYKNFEERGDAFKSVVLSL